MSDQSIFSKFTNLYSLTKTLRFELKPVGKTLENMKNNLGYDIDLQTFLKDQEIEDAYNLIKPELDKIHEEFINEALTLNEDSDIDFESYFNEYKKSDNRDLKEFEKNLRSQIDSLFIKTSEIWKTKYKNKYVFKKGSAVAKSFNILLTKDMVKLVKDKNISNEVNNAVGKIYSFYGYLAGYNQNRENYYTTKDEKATAIATRIVHDNLPKYCDNLKQFEKIIKRKKNKVTKKVTEIIRETKLEYLGIYEYVKSKEIDPTLLKAIDESFFEINNYRKYLSQSDIEKYNGIIGDYNYLINLYNQHKKQDYKELKDEDKFQSLPQFKTLYKQIGCGKKDALFFAITHDSKEQSQQNKENFSKPYSLQELLLNTKKGVEKLITADQSGDGEICNVNDFINYILQKEDYEGLYWSKKVMNTISNLYIGNWFHVQELCQKSKVFGRGSKKENYKVIIPEAIPLTGLFEVLDSVENWREVGLFKVKAYEDEAKQIIFENTEYSASQTLLRFIVEDIKKELDQLKKTGDGLVKITDYKNQDNKDKIKAYLDSIKKVLSIIQYFSVNESKIKNGGTLDPIIVEALKDIIFEPILENYEINWFKWYDAVRNYLTKKPQDDVKENKLKLNFESSSLLEGWADSPEGNTQYKAFLLKNGEKYLLGITNKPKIFDKQLHPNAFVENSEWKKMIYKQLDGKTIYGSTYKGEFDKKYLDNESVNQKDLIQNVKKMLQNKITIFPELKELLNKEYNLAKELAADIANLTMYYTGFENISKEYLEQIQKEGNLYLLEIYSKDLYSIKKTGKDLQVIYFNNLFSENNLNNLVYKLNGKGEIFYRKIGLKERNIKKGYENKPWVIKGKRFTDSSTKDSKGKQFFFHFPITINAKKISGVRDGRPNGNAIKKVNEIFLNYLESESENLYYLGIDRGEKHLAYYCLVNSKGEIISQGSLNLPFVDKDGKPCSVNANIMISKDDGTFEIETVTCWNYNDLLEARAGNRDFARKNWQAIDSIKNLKNGYVSQVITEIIKNAVNLDNPKLTFIVLEDLNTGFKRSRIKIENQVYQKLELALAKKLNFYVNKKVESGVGSVTQALQLTPPVTNYQDIENKKQLGIMLYTRPNYTSVTDPVTGWRKSVYIQKGSEEKVKNQIIEKFTDITWEDGDYCFEYKDSNTNKIWKLYSGKNGKTLDRFRGKKNDHGKWEIKPINVKSILDEVFNEKEFDKNRSLLSQIVDEGKEISAIIDMGKWDSLRYAIDLIQQIRNIGNNERDQDFIFSPIRDNNGNYFDSREYWDKEKNNEKVDLPTCGDANGAYNIARKGIIMNYMSQKGYEPYISEEIWDNWLLGIDHFDKWFEGNLVKFNKKINR